MVNGFGLPNSVKCMSKAHAESALATHLQATLVFGLLSEYPSHITQCLYCIFH